MYQKLSIRSKFTILLFLIFFLVLVPPGSIYILGLVDGLDPTLPALIRNPGLIIIGTLTVILVLSIKLHKTAINLLKSLQEIAGSFLKEPANLTVGNMRDDDLDRLVSSCKEKGLELDKKEDDLKVCRFKLDEFLRMSRENEDKLREKESLTRTILDNAFDAVISMDQNGVVTSWNNRAEAIFGWRPEEIIGKPLSETIIPPQYVDAHNTGLERFLTTGESRVLNRQIELTALHRKGHEIPVEISIAATEWGNSYIFTGIIRDISERRKSQEQTDLRSKEYRVLNDVSKALNNAENLKAMLDIAIDAIANFSELKVINKAGIFLADEEKRILRLYSTKGEFPWDFLKGEEEVSYGSCLCGKAAVSGEMLVSNNCYSDPRHERQYENITPHGSYIVPLKRGKKLVGIMFLYTQESPPWYERSEEILLSIGELIADAIEHRRIEEKVLKQNVELAAANDKLKELNELKNKFLGIASHDLRNPLYMIKTFGEALLDSARSGSPHKEQLKLLGKICNSTEHMTVLLNNLLDISKIESGKIVLEKKVQDFNAVSQSQIELNQLLANKKNIKLCPGLGELPPVPFDKNAVIQVIDNFIGNAIKFSPPNTQIMISTKNLGDILQLSVKDEGPGISPEDQKLLFGEFQTLSARPTGGEKSTGLGLAIVKKIVNLHGGDVGVVSEVGKGSTFYFTLPLK